MAPNCTSSWRTSQASAGVGKTPSNSTSQPAELRPAASAASNISQDWRVSQAMSTRGRGCSLARTAAADCPRCMASWGVNWAFANPRTPSVPKSLRSAIVLVFHALNLLINFNVLNRFAQFSFPLGIFKICFALTNRIRHFFMLGFEFALLIFDLF